MLAAFPGEIRPGSANAQALPDTAAVGHDGFDVQRDVLDHVSSGQFEALAAALAPDCLLLLPGLRPVSGTTLIKRVLRGIRRRYQSLRFETVLQFRSPDDVFVANSMVHGRRNDGSFYENDVITLVRLDRSGRVALITDYYKDTSGSARVDAPHPRHA